MPIFYVYIKLVDHMSSSYSLMSQNITFDFELNFDNIFLQNNCHHLHNLLLHCFCPIKSHHINIKTAISAFHTINIFKKYNNSIYLLKHNSIYLLNITQVPTYNLQTNLLLHKRHHFMKI